MTSKRKVSKRAGRLVGSSRSSASGSWMAPSKGGYSGGEPGSEPEVRPAPPKNKGSVTLIREAS